ncbi:MAG: DNA helicase, partial [Methylotenera sp.]
EFVDYNTGQIPNLSSWGEVRISEAHLPIYATFFNDDEAQTAGIYFGMVKTAEHGFSGLSEEQFNDEQGKRKPPFINQFTDWPALLMHWKTAIENIAQELREGEAAVRFNDEAELAYC